MKYNTFIKNYLAEANETIGAFAKRAGVSRVTVYRAMNKQNILIEPLEKIIVAAGGSLEIVAGNMTAPPTAIIHKEESLENG